MTNLSNFGWAALDQLKRSSRVWDGDLVSKTGRTELLDAGLAERKDGFQWLTDAGRKLAAQYSGDETSRRS